jgi:hypothetical protein
MSSILVRALSASIGIRHSEGGRTTALVPCLLVECIAWIRVPIELSSLPKDGCGLSIICFPVSLRLIAQDDDIEAASAKATDAPSISRRNCALNFS